MVCGGRVVSVSLAVAVVLACLVMPVEFSASVGGAGYRLLFAVPVDGAVVRAVSGWYGVGDGLVGGIRHLVYVDLRTALLRPVASAESLGLDLRSARYVEAGDRLVVFDGRTALALDGSMNMLGRVAGDNLAGANLLPSGNLVAWGGDYVLLSPSPGYVGVRFYDVWGAFFSFLLGGGVPPNEWLRRSRWVNVSEVIDRLRQKLIDAASALGGAVVGEQSLVYYDIQAPTVRESREKLRVEVAAATVLGDGAAYAAVNVVAPVVVKVVGRVNYVTADGVAKTETLEFAEVFSPQVGALVSVAPDGTMRLLEMYDAVEAGAMGSALAYVYRPLTLDTLKPKVLRVLLEDGRNTSAPIYFAGRVTEIKLVGDGSVSLVLLDTGIALLFRWDTLLWSFAATKVADIGISPAGKVYVAYTNEHGACELGYVDVYSGRAGKVSVDLPHEVSGVYVGEGERTLIVAKVVGTGTEVAFYASQQSTARLRITLVDHLGRVVSPPVWGELVVSSKDMLVRLSFSENPVVVEVPAPSTVNVTASVFYGVARDSISVLAPADGVYPVVVRMSPSPRYTGAGATLPYTSPFYLDHVLVRDAEVMKYVLPGARYIDAFEAYLVAVRGRVPAEPSTVSLHRLGGDALWTKTYYAYIESAFIAYPYVVLKGVAELHVLDLVIGATRGSISMPIDGFDVDLESDYASAWNSRTVAVLDIRRGETSYIDMSKHGAVLVAPVVGNSVYAYIRRGDAIDVYVFNPSRGTITEVLPLRAGDLTGFATDGFFKAVSYVVAGERYTSVLSAQNGVVVIQGAGPVLSVRSIGRMASVPQWNNVYGNSFALLLVSEGDGYSLYAVGMNYAKILGLDALGSDAVRLSVSFIAERLVRPNASPAIVLRDLGGAPRLTLVTSIPPAAFAVSEQMIAYSDGDTTYVIPNPRITGRYILSLTVRDAETMQPVDATVAISEYRTAVEARGGSFRTYLSLPGRLTLVISAPNYHEQVVEVELSDNRPVATLSVALQPKLFSISVSVVTPEGEAVREGTLTVQRKEPPLKLAVDLSQTNRVGGLRVGNYTVVFTSDAFTPASADVILMGDVSLTLVVNRTTVRTFFRVRDEAGKPIPGARVSLSVERVGSVELTTNASGETPVVALPYRATFNYTVYARGYSVKRDSGVASLAVEGKPITVALAKIRGVATIMLRDEEGKPVAASISIRDAQGNDVVPVVMASDVYTVDLEMGLYTVVGVTPDGRTASATLAITEDMLNPVASLVFPVQPQPAHVRYFPVILAVVAGATAVVAVYRKFFAKKKPKVVT